MPRHGDLHAHFSGTLHHRVKVVHLEPQQDAVSVWLVGAIADRTVVVVHLEAVQLENNLAVPDQLLIFAAAMVASAAQQSLIPAAACFHIANSDERLRTHAV